ncbi:heme-copper oxidase subunit III [Rhodocytophaga rosea]|uniref:Heme-copper oxidase subunit III n=1 Tax=Rhodocytophaga rosea TaxID=2704465 RepID=A0A6C0GNW9_9BACT|nr:cytochrome c oxidase subunit 3 [Rhodocytophaga rosea]QHT69544.1 heme-copper oxidase subunit III [Rhodocytophaga rosea]
MSNILTRRREPFRFMLIVGIVGIVFLFLTLSLLYLLRKSSTDWVAFHIPLIFWVSTGMILLSSITLHQAIIYFKREHFRRYRWSMGITLLLGVLFICTQLLGWWQLTSEGIGMKTPAGAFLYMLTGLHILHILGGIVFLSVAFVHAVKRPQYVDSFVYSVNPPNLLRLQLGTVYWHFVDGLWIYLFLFLLYHQG